MYIYIYIYIDDIHIDGLMQERRNVFPVLSHRYLLLPMYFDYVLFSLLE